MQTSVGSLTRVCWYVTGSNNGSLYVSQTNLGWDYAVSNSASAGMEQRTCIGWSSVYCIFFVECSAGYRYFICSIDGEMDVTPIVWTIP